MELNGSEIFHALFQVVNGDKSLQQPNELQ